MATFSEPKSPTRSEQQVERQELASFLRSRREQLSPEQVGLPMTGRRRTPGLRREEVALLAGVGVTWYTWLEQGRAIHVSESVVASIARALRLAPYERAHLYTLAGHTEPPMELESAAIPKAMLVVLRQLEPIPAAVINTRFDLLAYNRTYEQLVGGIEHLDARDRNWLLLMLTSSTWRGRVLDWDDTVARLVGRFRANMAAHAAESPWKNLVTRLRRESVDFERLWERHEVRGPESFTKRYLHPDVGVITLDYMQLSVGEHSGIKLATYTPRDDESWTKVRQLHDTAAVQNQRGAVGLI